MMVALFDNTTSSDDTMQAITQIRGDNRGSVFCQRYVRRCYGHQKSFMEEMPIYVVIAALLCLVILGRDHGILLGTGIVFVSIGAAIIYNLGTDTFLGEISYITQALTAVPAAWCYDGLLHFPFKQL